jgi:large-conductance mechanosensitive channel
MSADSTLMTFAVAIYIGAALASFFAAVTRDLITPIIAGLVPGAEKTLDKMTITIGNVRLSIGDVLAAALNLGIAFLVVQMTLPYIRQYAPLSGGRR